MTWKRCTKCGQMKPASEFYSRGGGRSGIRPSCKACASSAANEWRKRNRDRNAAASRRYRQRHGSKTGVFDRRRHYRNSYGISVEDFDAMLAAQGGCCAICGGGPGGRGRFHVDHCHTTGRLRGLLCARCNLALGLLREDPEVVAVAAVYLQRP